MRDLLHMIWRGGACGIAVGAAKGRLELANRSCESASSSAINPLRWDERVKILLETSHMERSYWVCLVESQHEQREVAAASFALEHTCKTSLVKIYVDDLFLLSLYPHATARAAAQYSIVNLGRAFESYVNKALPGLTAILTAKSPVHASGNGWFRYFIQVLMGNVHP